MIAVSYTYVTAARKNGAASISPWSSARHAAALYCSRRRKRGLRPRFNH
jgi:hypothetical protein